MSGLLYAAPPSTLNKFISLSAGPAWYHAGRTQTISLQPDYANTYAAATPLQTLARGEVFLGVQHTLPLPAIAQFGLAVTANSAAKLQGEIWETADPLFNNFTYQYHVSNVSILAKTKWLLDGLNTSLLPYFSVGCGIAINNSYGYSMSPLIFEALTVPGFQHHQETTFTYTLGVGVHKILNLHWQLGIGYEWSDWGHSALGAAPGQSIGTGVNLNHIETQQLQFILNYLI